LQKLKHKVKATGNFLPQIVNRLTEESYTTDKKSNELKLKKYLIIIFLNNNNDGFQWIKSLEYENYFLGSKKGNNCFRTHCGGIILIQKSFIFKGKNFINIKQPFFQVLCNSSFLNVKVIANQNYTIETIDASQIAEKCINIPISDEKKLLYFYSMNNNINHYRIFIRYYAVHFYILFIRDIYIRILK